MAEIYRARYVATAGVTKPVVIKKILPALAGNRAFIQMFINEARIAVGLSHGNIAQVFDFGEIEGEYFLAMELVHGQPLSKTLKRARHLQLRALPATYASAIIIEVLQGLHYAHTRLDEAQQPLDIVHRDVSPQNIILSYEGQVKLVDFGIAKVRSTDRTQTASGAVKGKYLYFSPEQAQGRPLDARSDVFAAGTLLYEMVCGRLPFIGKMVPAMRAIVKGNFPRPRNLNAELSAGLEQVILTALHNDREQRYRSAQAFQEALTQLMHEEARGFPVHGLQDLMHFLFEPELTRDGIPVEMSRALLAQLPGWRKSSELDSTLAAEVADRARVGAGPPPLPPLLPMPKLPAGPPAPGGVDTSSPTRPDPPSRRASKRPLPVPAGMRAVRLPPWTFVGVPFFAMVTTALLVLAFGATPSFVIELRSSPPGAALRVDGQPASAVTPLRLRDLSTGRDHVLELRAPGMKPWIQHVQENEPLTVELNATLQPEASPLPVAPVRVNVKQVSSPRPTRTRPLP